MPPTLSTPLTGPADRLARSSLACFLGAVACAQLVHAVWLVLDGAEIRLSYLCAHALLIALLSAFGWLLGRFVGGGMLAAWVLVLPVASAIRPDISESFGRVGVALTGLLAVLLIGLASRIARDTAGRCWVAAGLGAFIAGWFSQQGAQGTRILPLEASSVAGAAALSGFLLLSLGLLRKWDGTVGKRGLGVLLALGSGLVLVLYLVVRAPGVYSGPRASGGRCGVAPPIVLIVLDTVRADHLGVYGYERDTMPQLEAFARRHGRVFDRAISSGASSLPTHGSLFTGLYPPRHGAHELRQEDATELAAFPLRADVPTVAELLRSRGYWTVAISANYAVVSAEMGFARGFARFRSQWRPAAAQSPWVTLLTLPGLRELSRATAAVPWVARADVFSKIPYRRAHEISQEAVAAVSAAEDCAFFLFVNFFDAHAPYRPPAAFGRPYEGYRSSLLDGLEGNEWLSLMRGETELDGAMRDHFVAAYDGELAYLDSELAGLLEALEVHPRFDEMLIVVTSDHGEALGDHGVLGHGMTLYEEMIHIPLVVKRPQGPRLRATGTPVLSTDVAAGILDFANVAAPPAFDGVPWGRGRTVAPAWSHIQNIFRLRGVDRLNRDLVSVERGRWKLIRSSRGSVELFDLVLDEGELSDLAGDHEQLQLELLAYLEQLDEIEPPRRQEPGLQDEQMERLRALGYVD